MAEDAGHLLLFNTERFCRLNLSAGQSYARFDTVDGGRLVGTVAGVVDGDTFVSGYSAPFGGPDFVRGNETAEVVGTVIGTALDGVRQSGLTRMVVRARPAAYGDVEALVLFTLLNRGFMVTSCDLNQHIDLRGMTNLDDYVASLKSPARRALGHLAAEPFEFGEAQDRAEWEVAYDVLAENRRAKGRTLKLDLDYVLGVRDNFGEQIRLFVLRHNGDACAAALTFDVLARHRLVVYWGDSFHDLPRSPMNSLALQVVGGAIADGIEILDLGISSVDGLPDQGLFRFKRSVLARPSARLVLTGSP